MQIHGIKRQADANEVAHIDPEIVSSTIDMHVVCLHGKVELSGFFQDVSAQVRVRLETRVFAVCKICHVPLQLKIVNVDGREERSECRQRSQYPNRRRDSLAGYLVHVRSAESFPEAQSSAQMSSECGVHSALESPEICSSSSRSVPWP